MMTRLGSRLGRYFQFRSIPVRLVVFTLVAAALVVAGSPAQAGPQAVGKTAGRTYGEWSAAWWQWVFSIPAPNPQLAQGELDCSVHQSGAVWFLAGSPTGAGGFERSCDIPRGKALFFPVLNAIFTNGPGEAFTVAEKRDQLGRLLDDTDPGPFADFGFPGTRACDLTATLDGQPLTFFVPDARVQSPPFVTDTGDGASGFPAGIVDPEAISDGFWVMMPPLAPGEHALHFSGRYCEFDSFDTHPLAGGVDITYHLTVDGGVTGLEGLSNLEIIQALYDAFAAGNGATIDAILHPDVVWVESEGIPYGGTFVGRDAVFAGVFAKIAAEWDGFTATVDDIFEADGDRVVVKQRDGGTFKATGKSMEAPAISIWTLDGDGRAIRFEQVIDTQEVNSAVIP